MHTQPGFPKPKGGASLLLSFRLHARSVVIIGSGKLAASRAFSCLESDASVILLGQGGLANACEEVQWRVEQGQLQWRAIEEEARHWRAQQAASSSSQTADTVDEAALHSVLSSLPSVSLVCITDTIISSIASSAVSPRSRSSASLLYSIASQTYGIPTNTTDVPSLCDFAFPSTHRFRSAESGEPTALQIGITTNSKGCRLSSRITREVVARLPKGVGDAVDKVGRLRDKAKADESRWVQRVELSGQGDVLGPLSSAHVDQTHESDGEVLPSTPNEPVPQRPSPAGPLRVTTGVAMPDLEVDSDETSLSRTQRRMRWVAQVSEYWPIESLASLDDKGINSILSGTSASLPHAVLTERATPGKIAPAPTQHVLAPLDAPLPNVTRGRILLLGSGPGHPSLLTLATSRALQTADLVLSDKLVPEGVLHTIPKREWIILSADHDGDLVSDVELRIARKFPGNADRAQEELMHAALEAAQQGKVVVRLKQGDPMLYARASAEIEYFTAHAYPPTVVPGLSSALAAPLAAGIPVTARGVAEGVAICTGVGKGGKSGRVSSYDRGTTVLVLMGVARLAEIVRSMMEDTYPEYIPTCIIERGTMPDQRLVRSTLGGIVEAMSDPRLGAQRPPGMMVVGWACLGIAEGIEGVSDDGGEGLRDRDLERINKWLGGERFVVKEGLDETWQEL